MKTNFKLSSKMHLFIVISALIVALGIAVGLICNFTAGGYFNYSGEWTDYKSVTVTYKYVDFSGDGDPMDTVKDICEQAFESNGLSGYSATYGTTSAGGEVVYRFSTSTEDSKLETAKTSIESSMKTYIGSDTDVVLSNVTVHSDDALLGGTYTLVMAAIAIASIIGVQFVYFLIRYKLTMAFAAILANVHNLAIYVSLLSLCRVPISASAIAFAVICVILTMIGCAVLFDKTRKIIKDEAYSKLSSIEQADLGAGQSFKTNLLLPLILIAVTVVFALIFIIGAATSSGSVALVLTPALTALVCFISCAYGTAFFTPAVYSRFKKKGDEFRAKHVKATKAKDENKPKVRRGRRAAQGASAASPDEVKTSD